MLKKEIEKKESFGLYICGQILIAFGLSYYIIVLNKRVVTGVGGKPPIHVIKAMKKPIQ